MANTRQTMVAGNWKMHGTQAFTQQFFTSLANENLTTGAELLICPPFTTLQTAKQHIEEHNLPIALGAQTLSVADSGAYTGQISAEMLLELGATHVIVGHSERRQYQQEDNALIAQQVSQALNHGLIPIACVGETFEQRDADLTDKIIVTQVEQVLATVPSQTCPSRVIVAYEPVWAIGTGKTCDAAEANRVCGLIRQTVAKLLGQPFADGVRILYGGSVKPSNAKELFAQSDIDGGLVGGASLKPADFVALAQAAPQLCPA